MIQIPVKDRDIIESYLCNDGCQTKPSEIIVENAYSYGKK